MTDTNAAAGALGAMKVAELQAVASQMGITGIGKMRKADLVAVISAHGAPAASAPQREAERPARAESPADDAARRESPTRDAARDERRSAIVAEVAAAAPAADGAAGTPAPTSGDSEQPSRRRSRRAGSPAATPSGAPAGEPTASDDSHAPEQRDERPDAGEGGDRSSRRNRRDRAGERGQEQGERQQHQDRQNGDRQQNQGDRQQGQNQGGQGQNDRYDDEESGGRRRRNRNRGRDRKRGRERQPGQGGQGFEDQEQQVSEDDVLVPVAGILDVQDQYAFLRTSGYLPGQNDVYVPINMVKRNGLRKGDAVIGAVKARDEDFETPTVQNRRNAAKFNALVRLDSINGMTIEQAKKRVDFNSLTPLYPQERLRLETDSKNYTTRIIDLVAPIGKGQRGLIVSPAKAGKTMIMQNIANAITQNNPEVHLMVVLVDERPEEVTDFERSVRGEVISSTFDRPASDHTIVAELAIERAKRLVEMGRDVVVLLDGITRLGRAYNLAAPASGRILSGGVDSAALYPPKKFFGAARNIENGGSLTILATALVESGSKMDEVIFEEFKGTGNMELRLSRQLAERRTFPAIDVNASGTRREEILLAGDELKIMWKLRRLLSALDPQQSLELLLSQMKKTNHNYEFLVQVQQNASIKMDDEG